MNQFKLKPQCGLIVKSLATYKSGLRKKGERRLSFVPTVAFRGETGSRPPVLVPMSTTICVESRHFQRASCPLSQLCFSGKLCKHRSHLTTDVYIDVVQCTILTCNLNIQKDDDVSTFCIPVETL